MGDKNSAPAPVETEKELEKLRKENERLQRANAEIASENAELRQSNANGAKENESLRARIAALDAALRAIAEAGGSITEEVAEDIKARMAAGLTKEQAIDCAKQQAAWDAELAKGKKK